MKHLAAHCWTESTQYFIVKASSGALGELSGKTVEKEPTT